MIEFKFEFAALISTVDLDRQSLSSLIAYPILVKVPFVRRYIIKQKKIGRHMVCANKKHIEQQTQRKSPAERNITLTSTNYYNSNQTLIFRFLQANFDTIFWDKSISSYCNNTFLHLLPILLRKTIFS